MTEMQANDERGRKYEQQKAYAPGAGDEADRSEHLYGIVRTPTSLRCLNKSSGSW
jgi:hypothetical protein